MNRRFFLRSSIALGAVAALSRVPFKTAAAFAESHASGQTDAALPFQKIIKTDAEWKRLLTPEQYYI
ncbi:MAG TPA: hypothetical protein VGO91_05560, partial [Pyrinomonadaceae bacterium]|nr:hypothetical protein [Pyrinomonadaceae bacterium]